MATITERLHAEIDLVPLNRREPLLTIVHAYREAVDDEIDAIDPEASIRQGLADLRAGRVHPIETLWDGIEGA